MAHPPKNSRSSGRGYLIEYIQRGNAIKVTAIDPRTGVEVSMVGTPKVSQHELNRLVVRKLELRLKNLQEAAKGR